MWRINKEKKNKTKSNSRVFTFSDGLGRGVLFKNQLKKKNFPISIYEV